MGGGAEKIKLRGKNVIGRGAKSIEARLQQQFGKEGGGGEGAFLQILAGSGGPLDNQWLSCEW